MTLVKYALSLRLVSSKRIERIASAGETRQKGRREAELPNQVMSIHGGLFNAVFGVAGAALAAF